MEEAAAQLVDNSVFLDMQTRVGNERTRRQVVLHGTAPVQGTIPQSQDDIGIDVVSQGSTTPRTPRVNDDELWNLA